MFAAPKMNQAFQQALRSERKLPPQPEPTYGQPRPAVGFFAALSPSQKASALGYRGEENHGEPEFAR
jgi:hypothetical protein